MNRAASASRPPGFDPHSRRAIARILPVAKGLRPWCAQGIQTLPAASTRIPMRRALVRTLGATRSEPPCTCLLPARHEGRGAAAAAPKKQGGEDEITDDELLKQFDLCVLQCRPERLPPLRGP